MRWSGGKTKIFFTLGIYWSFWHSYVCEWLRDTVGVETPEQDWWRLFIPIYNLVVLWKFYAIIRRVEIDRLGGTVKPLSVVRAFFWSCMWFAAVPYVNRHLNFLAAHTRGTENVTVNVAAVAS